MYIVRGVVGSITIEEIERLVATGSEPGTADQVAPPSVER